MEAYEHNLSEGRSAPTAVSQGQEGGGEKPDWTFNILLKHGVRACLEYVKSFDRSARDHHAERTGRRSNQVPDLAHCCPVEERRAPRN
jgi:hypothetical protein